MSATLSSSSSSFTRRDQEKLRPSSQEVKPDRHNETSKVVDDKNKSSILQKSQTSSSSKKSHTPSSSYSSALLSQAEMIHQSESDINKSHPHYIPEPSTPNLALSTPRTPSSKPRAGRKRWALNFGSKTGSLKSIKSESGSHKSVESLDGSASTGKGGGFGPLMMATLHGLTRSRPDLLAESMATFSQPSKMPKDEIGAYLEAKLEEGEVLREFERIPKKKMTNCHFNTAVLAENILRNRFKVGVLRMLLLNR